LLIVGEPGLGKSRLVEEFRAQLAESPHTWVEWSASQLLQNTPLHPIAEWGRQRFGGADVPAEKRLADLERSLREVDLDTDAAAPLLAPLLDIPLPAGREASLAPKGLRRQQLAAIVSWVISGARAQPVVLAFEDLQWADPTSIDLFRALAEQGQQAPLLLIPTARPEFRAPWGMRSHHSVMSLAPLDRAQVARMVGELASRHALSQEVVEGVSERTGGVPLFVEEVTRLLLERGVRAARKRSPRPCSSLSRRALIGSGQRAKRRRSAPCLDAVLPTRYCATSPKSTSQRCRRRLSGSPVPISFSSRGRRRGRTIASSTR
jgi:predicted ATPase